MFRYTCLNPIAQTGLDGFFGKLSKTEELNDADAISGAQPKCMRWNRKRACVRIAREQCQ